MFDNLIKCLFGAGASRSAADANKEAQEKQERAFPPITSATVESAIDQAGRAAVFARAKSLGWSVANPAPLWVWNQIAYQIIAETREARAIQERQTATLN